MSEVRVATEEEIAGFGFPEFGENQVDTVWNGEASVAYSRYKSNKVQVTNILDYRNTPIDFLRQLANEQAKIMGTRVSLDLIAAGNDKIYIPVEEEILRPGRTGGRSSLTVNKLIVLMGKERDGTLTEEEEQQVVDNEEKITELKSAFGV